MYLLVTGTFVPVSAYKVSQSFLVHILLLNLHLCVVCSPPDNLYVLEIICTYHTNYFYHFFRFCKQMYSYFVGNASNS